MKRTFQLVLVLAVIGMFRPSYCGPEPTLRDVGQTDLDAMISQRHEQISQFMMRIGRAQTGCAPDLQMDLAIRGLGELRAAEAAGQLSWHLMYLPEKLTADDRFTTEMYYPAAVALAHIGQPSIQYMLERIGYAGSSDERNLAAWVIMTVEGKSQAMHRLDDLIAKDDRCKPAYAAAREFLADYKLSFALPTRKPVPAASAEGMSLPMRDNGIVLQEIAPTEYDLYKKSIEAGYGLKTVDATLALIARAEAVCAAAVAEKSADQRRAFHARMAPLYAWTHLLEIYHKTSDADAKAAVLAAWNKAIDGRADIPALLGALNNEWDRAFFTEGLRKLFKETKNSDTIQEFCRVMGRHGEDPEEALLREKRPTLKTMGFDYTVYRVCLSNIDGALQAIAWWRAGDKDRAGPGSTSYRDDWPF